jgi:hypothetical protein
MERRRCTREFKLQAVRLIEERGVSYAQRLGQRRDGELLLVVEDRANSAQGVPITVRGEGRRV